MTLDVSGTGFIAYVLGRLAGLVHLHPSDATLLLASQVLLAVFVVLVVLTIVPGFVWAMRKVMADIQSRIGPSRVGPYGALQVLADGLKMMTKEDVVPARADHFAFALAPFVMMVPVLLAFAPLPWSQGIVLGNIGAGILFILAVGAISPLGEVLAGWSSNNKYAMYGGLRAAALDVSYEVPMVISALAVVFLAGTLNTEGIVAAQQPWWFFVLQPIGVVVFFASAMAKIGVVPLDLPEAESELVAGYFTEYSGMRYGVFMLTLFTNIFLMSAITVMLYFGGWGTLPPWAIAGVLLSFLAILLARRKGTGVNVAPPMLAGMLVSVSLTYLFHFVSGAGQGLVTLAWSPTVADHFFGPAATPGNFIAMLGQAYDFLIPSAIIMAAVATGLVLAEGGKARDLMLPGAVALGVLLAAPLLLFLLAPFLAVGTAGGIANFVIGGIEMFLLPVKPLALFLGFALATGAVAAALVRRLDDPILGATLALGGVLAPLMLIPFTSFLLKALLFSFTVFWIWFTLPRVRVDQFLRLGWRTMFPLSLVTLVMAGAEAILLRGGGL